MTQREPSTLEVKFAELWHKLYPHIELVPEFRFHPKRLFRLDFAHLATKIGIEISGGHYSQGRHVRAVGYRNDCIKYAFLASDNWLVFTLVNELIKPANLELIAQTIVNRGVGYKFEADTEVRRIQAEITLANQKRKNR